MNRVIGFTIYEARVTTPQGDFTVDFTAASLDEAYPKLERLGIRREQIVDLFPAPTRRDHYDPHSHYPFPLCQVR